MLWLRRELPDYKFQFKGPRKPHLPKIGSNLNYKKVRCQRKRPPDTSSASDPSSCRPARPQRHAHFLKYFLLSLCRASINAFSGTRILIVHPGKARFHRLPEDQRKSFLLKQTTDISYHIFIRFQALFLFAFLSFFSKKSLTTLSVGSILNT